jgi:hypothetical protein
MIPLMRKIEAAAMNWTRRVLDFTRRG